MLRLVPRWLCALALLVAGSSRVLAQEAILTWRGEDRALTAVSGEAASACSAARAWHPFASENGCRFVLSDDARVLLVLCESYARRGGKKEHHDVEVMRGLLPSTCAATDRIFPPVAGDEPVVVLGVRAASYPKLLDHVTKVDPRLKAWACSAGARVNGFVLSEPLVAAWIDDPPGVDEWHAHNELVHRTAQLLIRRQAPQLPSWLLLGLAWHVEETVQDSVYCFPYRSGFVSACEHTDWGLTLANNFKPARRKKDGKEPVLSIQEFADWVPGSADDFTGGRAYVAFGVARYLAHEKTTAVQDLAAKFNAAIEKGSKVWVSATEWKTVPDYRIPVEEQLAMLNAVEGDLLAKVTDYFQKRKANERRPLARK